MRERLAALLFYDPDPVEIGNGVTCLIMGAWIVLLCATGGTFPIGILTRLAPASAWGAVTLLVGAASLRACLSRKRVPRVLLAHVRIYWWGFLSLTVALTSLSYFAVPMLVSLMLSSAWIIWRLEVTGGD